LIKSLDKQRNNTYLLKQKYSRITYQNIFHGFLKIKALMNFKEKEIGSISVTAIPIIHSSRKELAIAGL
jgi:hypothetical protein